MSSRVLKSAVGDFLKDLTSYHARDHCESQMTYRPRTARTRSTARVKPSSVSE